MTFTALVVSPIDSNQRQRSANMEQQYLTTKELAELTRASESTIRHWQRTGQAPPSVKIGRRRLYPLSEVQKWLNR